MQDSDERLEVVVDLKRKGVETKKRQLVVQRRLLSTLTEKSNEALFEQKAWTRSR